MKKRMLGLALWTVMAAAICLIAMPDKAVAAETYYQIGLNVQYGQTEARSMLPMINSFRTGSDAWYWNDTNTAKVNCTGLQALTYDYELEKVAMQRAAELAIAYGHGRPDLSTYYEAYGECGYVTDPKELKGNFSYGENVAAGYQTAATVFQAWREDNEDHSGQGHRRNMLSTEFAAVGIGHVYYNGYHFWVQEFSSVNETKSETPALDAEKTVPVKVAASAIKNRTAKLSGKKSISLKCGKTEKLGKIEIQLSLDGVGVSYDANPGTVLRVPFYSFIKNTPVMADAVWESDKNCVSVTDGVLKGVSEGTAKLTAAVFGGMKVSVNVSVAHNPKQEGKAVAATTKKNGKTAKTVCAGCKKVLAAEKNISAIKKMTIPKTKYTYTGKAVKPKVTVTDKAGKKIASTNYSVSYKNNIKLGKATVTVTFKGNYAGTLKKTFQILPKGTTLSGLQSKTGAFTAVWRPVKDASTGYELAYSTDKKCGRAKTVRISNSAVTEKKVTGLARNKAYYVRIRTFSLKGKKTYSEWSKIKSVKTR